MQPLCTARSGILWLFLFLLVMRLAQAATPPILHYVLANGLNVVLQEDHRAPVIEVQMWYLVGGVDEPHGITGVSHALEHMMFRGTRQTTPGEFDLILNNIGAYNNAYTSNDHTVYINSSPKKGLPVILALEAERMTELLITESVFKPEHNVILEEWRHSLDSPLRYLSDCFLAMAFPASPYRQPVLGWNDDIQKLSAEKLQQWYQTWYQPNNATLVIVGDIEPEQTRALISRYFTNIKPAVLPERVSLAEQPEVGKREIVTTHSLATVPSFIMGFNVPALTPTENNWEPFALRMLTGILDEGYSARFESELIRKSELASEIGVSYDPFSRGESLLEISGSPNTSKQINSRYLVEQIWNLIEEIKQTPPNLKELQRVRAQIIAREAFSQDSLSRQANDLGKMVSLGFPADWNSLYLQHLLSVTPEQIQAVARTYLIPERSTVAFMMSKPQTIGEVHE